MRKRATDRTKLYFYIFVALTIVGWIGVIISWAQMYIWEKFECEIVKHSTAENDQLCYDAKFSYCTTDRKHRICNTKLAFTECGVDEADVMAMLYNQYPVNSTLDCYRNNYYDIALKTTTQYKHKSWSFHLPMLFVVPIIAVNIVLLCGFVYEQASKIHGQWKKKRDGGALNEPLRNYDGITSTL